MGLETTHNAWSDPYSAFMRFREYIAKAIGLELRDMEGFTGLKHGRASSGMVEKPIPWSVLGDEPLAVLLSHSDCEGAIDPKDCAAIAKRMLELRAEFEKQLILLDAKFGTQHRDVAENKMLGRYDRFVAGCFAAAAKDEPLEFE